MRGQASIPRTGGGIADTDKLIDGWAETREAKGGDAAENAYIAPS
ncbi:hypothetical protein [Streptomyces cyaneofuscatus]